MNVMPKDADQEANTTSKSIGKILIVDDEQSIRKSLRSILTRYKYQVDTAADYEEIKETLFTEGYDALILDIILPGINGVEILHKINKAELNLPTIMLTGAPSLDTAKESVKYGAFDYLTKPVEPSVLLNQLKNAVSRKRLVDQKKQLNLQLKRKNEELENLVEQRTIELKLSEIRYRTVVEAVHDMIIITDIARKIQFVNVVFLDEISEALGRHIHTSDVIGHDVNEYIEQLADLSIEDVYGKVAEGQEFDFMNCQFKQELNISKKFKSSIRGIFNEDLELQEVIVISSPKEA